MLSNVSLCDSNRSDRSDAMRTKSWPFSAISKCCFKCTTVNSPNGFRAVFCSSMIDLITLWGPHFCTAFPIIRLLYVYGSGSIKSFRILSLFIGARSISKYWNRVCSIHLVGLKKCLCIIIESNRIESNRIQHILNTHWTCAFRFHYPKLTQVVNELWKFGLEIPFRCWSN